MVAFIKHDPRFWQIISLLILSFLQIIASDFGTSLPILGLSVLSCLAVQWAWQRDMVSSLPSALPSSLPSALITGLSLSLLLRTDFLWMYPVAAIVAISSKFLATYHGKHFLNPANIAIVMLLLTLPNAVWISPGQWGSVAWLAALLTGLAGLVLSRAGRLDMALGFLGCWGGLLLARALWLGDPLAIPVHQIQSGALLIFTFFMITDPRSTPDHRWARLIFAAMVAMIGFALQFGLHIREGLFFALALVCLTTPILDSLIKSTRYQWGKIT